MSLPKFKHLRYEDRFVIQEFLNLGHNFSMIARRLNKDRRTISKEVWSHRFLKTGSAKRLPECLKYEKPPYVCNGCPVKSSCRRDQFLYEATLADHEYQKTLRQARSHLKISKEEIAAINDTITPLMVNKHHSVNQVFANHSDILTMSKSTFYRYVDMGLLNVKNIDLARKVRFRVKKEYDYSIKRRDRSYKLGRFYTDFRDYVELQPLTRVVEMDTVIGTRGGKGGKCLLTLLWRDFNFMLIYVLPYRRSEYVLAVFESLKKQLGDFEFSRLFEVILTDNGSEFSDPESIEISQSNGERLCFVFYCDSNCSWQKGCLEKNHEYIRYILPKGTSFAGITQETANLLASHINSVPRLSLNNQTPYDAALGFIGKDNMERLHIQRINADDVNLSRQILKH
ncbi:MAG: IS30 family transposase [Enterococcus sp.]|nr:IS30 family transposase [Enterococcus sp.]